MFRLATKTGIGFFLAQLVSVAFLPVLSRLYEPREYSVWAVVAISGMALGAISNLRYELAIVLPQRREVASSVLVLAFIFCTITLLVVTCAVFLIAGELDSSAKWKELIYFVPAISFSSGIVLALQHWAIRLSAYVYFSVVQTIAVVVCLTMQIVYGYIQGGHAFGLLLGTISGQVVNILLLLLLWRKSGCRPSFGKKTVSLMPLVFRRYSNCLKYSMPYALLGMARERAPLFISSAFFNANDVGLFALAHRAMNFPGALVGSILRPVVYREAVAHGINYIETNVNNFIRMLLLVSVPSAVVFLYYPVESFRFVFGESWVGASTYAQILLLPSITLMITNWLGRLLDSMEKQKISAALELVFSALSVGGFWLSVKFGLDLKHALIVQCVVVFVYHQAIILVVYKACSFEFAQLLRTFSMTIILALATSLLLSVVSG